MGPMWFLRMVRWARHPPSGRMVVMVLAVIAVSGVLIAVDKAGLWPAWLHVNSGPGPRLHLR